jgi:lipopolysaccharide export system permease protein
MKLIDKQITRELVGPFIFGVAAFSSVFFAGKYLLELTRMMMDGMSIFVAAQMIMLVLPSIVIYTLPMSTLLAVLLGVGRLSGDSEVVALFAGGVSMYRICIPVFALGLIVSISSITTNELVAPRAYDQYKSIESVVMKKALPEDQPFSVMDNATDTQITVKGGLDVDTGVLRNIWITRFPEDKPALVIHASRAVWMGLNDNKKKYRWRLYNGWYQHVGIDTYEISRFTESRTDEIELKKTPEQLSLYQKGLDKKTEEMNFSQMTALVKALKQHPDRPLKDIRQMDVDRWNKLALPISSLIFAMLAAPMGIKPNRSSSSVGFGLSILLIFLYWMLWHYTSELAIQGSISPVMGAFFADIIGVVVAIILLKKAAK